MFNTIAKSSTSEITEKKSKFICHAFHVESVEEAEERIIEIKKEYYDARHNCFAYSIGGEITKSSDDGEPSGTAGAPMLNILNGKEISNIVVIVTRYFGGILLGTGGLVRAYSEALQEALESAELIKQDIGLQAEFIAEYKDIEEIKYQLKNRNINIVDSKYDEKVSIIIEGSKEEIEKLEDGKLSDRVTLSNFKILKSKFVEIYQ